MTTPVAAHSPHDSARTTPRAPGAGGTGRPHDPPDPRSAAGTASTTAAGAAAAHAPATSPSSMVAALKPRLRGWIHAGTAPLALAACIVLTGLSLRRPLWPHPPAGHRAGRRARRDRMRAGAGRRCSSGGDLALKSVELGGQVHQGPVG